MRAVPGFDDGGDVGHRDRGFGDVGGDHDAARPAGLGPEDLLLLGVAQPRVEREDLDGAAAPRLRVGAEGLGGVADGPLGGHEHQHVAGAAERVVGDRVESFAQRAVGGGALEVDLVARVVFDRLVADVDGVGAAADLDDGRGLVVAAGKKRCEALRVDGGRGDDDLEVGPPRLQLLEVTQQEVDVE